MAYLKKVFAKNASDLTAGVDPSAPQVLFEVVNADGSPAGLPIAGAPLVGKGDCRYTLSTAKTLAEAADAATPDLGGIPAGATTVIIQPIGGPIYFTRDASVPTAILGLKIADGQAVTITSTAAGLAAIKLFAPAATPVNLQFMG